MFCFPVCGRGQHFAYIGWKWKEAQMGAVCRIHTHACVHPPEISQLIHNVTSMHLIMCKSKKLHIITSKKVYIIIFNKLHIIESNKLDIIIFNKLHIIKWNNVHHAN